MEAARIPKYTSSSVDIALLAQKHQLSSKLFHIKNNTHTHTSNSIVIISTQHTKQSMTDTIKAYIHTKHNTHHSNKLKQILVWWG